MKITRLLSSGANSVSSLVRPGATVTHSASIEAERRELVDQALEHFGVPG
jgi:hypothetical protein